MEKKTSTIEYYDTHASDFAGRTADLEFTAVQDRFLRLLSEGGHILDFGCGAGRDTKYFLGKGFSVTAADGSKSLCELAKKNTGIDVCHMLFGELNAVNAFDGIWACASVLHLPKEELADVFQKMTDAVKPGGYIYASFKYGLFEGFRGDRYFTDFTEDSFLHFAARFPAVELAEQWISADVRPGRGDEKWLNVILKKTQTA